MRALLAVRRSLGGQILLLDWVRDSAGHANWFQPDGLHLTYPGVYAFTALIDQAYPYAYVPCPEVQVRHVAGQARAGRLAITIRPSATVGGSLRVDLRDRSGAGGLSLRICLTPPGARSRSST